MRKISCFAGCVFFSLVWVTMASAVTNNLSAPQQQISMQSDQVIRPSAGISWKEKVMMQRATQKRAEARRSILMRQAERERQKSQKNIPPPSMNP